jgi:AMMECR1 domain-containing protein
MNRLRLLYLAYREWLLSSQIETAKELAEAHEQRAANIAAEHKRNLDCYHNELRKVRGRIALIAPPQALNVAIKAWRLL